MNAPLLTLCLVLAVPALAQVKVKKGKQTIDVDTAGATVTEDDGTGAAMKFSGLGGKKTHACTAGQNVDVEGMSQEITLTGDCGDVRVEGSSHRVDIEAAKKIVVEGTGNTVTWKRGVGGKDPKVTRAGLNNSVKKQ